MINKANLKQRKRELMLQGAQDLKKEKERSNLKLSGTASPEPFISKRRLENYELREFNRIKATKEPVKEINFFEKKIGDTYDTDKFPPSDLAMKSGRPVAMLHDYSPGRIAEGFATGFLVSSNLLLTNHHVFPYSGEANNCAATFLYEYDKQGLLPGVTFKLMPEKYFLAYATLDFALVYVEQVSVDNQTTLAEMGCLKLIETQGKILVGDPMNIIEYPMGRPKEYAYTENKVKDIDDVKGLIRYTTDTLSASSGSPGFNKYYEVAALHHCGVPYTINNEIYTTRGEVWDGEDEDEVQWIANEGISVSKIVAYLKELYKVDPKKNQPLEDLLDNSTDPLLTKNETNRTMNINTVEPLKQTPNDMGQFIFNFYGNTNIYINNEGGTLPVVKPEGILEPPVAPESKIRFDEDYSSRENKGFKKDFLISVTFELPEVDDSRKGEIYQLNGSDFILKYYHYSLVMNQDRRLQMWSAVNVNYDDAMKSKVHTSRASFGSEQGAWRTDERIPQQFQLKEKEIYKPAKNIDLGHIVRREDSCWGETEEEIEYANSDTFHLTNCTPQHEAFNQAHAKGQEYKGVLGMWGALEEEIKKQLKLAVNKACIFAGPVLDNINDPKYDFGFGVIQYPVKFWKIVAVVDQTEGLLSYGFLLDQSEVIAQFGLGVEKLNFDLFKHQQVPVGDLQKLTGLVFDKQLLQTDVLRSNFTEGKEVAITFSLPEQIQILPKSI
jgi:endonuclease G